MGSPNLTSKLSILQIWINYTPEFFIISIGLKPDYYCAKP